MRIIQTRSLRLVFQRNDRGSGVEYEHTHRESIVEQMEVGSDALSFAEALRAALHQDPDVILVGEMRDLETIRTVLTAAESPK